MELGGIYFFVNALMNVLSWFVAAALYSLYYPAGAAEPAHGTLVNFSANFTGANSAGAPFHVRMQPNGCTHSVLSRVPQA